MAKARIYTRRGDGGQTGLFDGRRVAKDTVLIEAIGAVDELNCTIGAVKDKKVRAKLENIQRDLFGIGSRLAGYEKAGDKAQRLEKRVEEMEREIDRMWEEMPPLSNFILPRGQLHSARAICRRAERAAVAARAKFAWQYLNRLSDYLFCLARWVNYKSGVEEAVWRSFEK